ncbi:MAG: DUF4430 domain-containing protein [Clostridia bacterium]|nr:DUF4430 domain-containing protein [Clostridia bacterium]
MKRISNKKFLSSLLSLALVATMVLFCSACKSEEAKLDTGSSVSATEVGQGATAFVLEVTDKQGVKTCFNVKTDKTTVGEALLEEKIIEGEQGAYGLYIKTVNGVTCDFDVDGYYWAFYVNGEYATSGVDTTNIEQGQTYGLKAQK